MKKNIKITEFGLLTHLSTMILEGYILKVFFIKFKKKYLKNGLHLMFFLEQNTKEAIL